ncbi:MAG TPA: class I SAM-dependent methyltransferase [Steroidobacteraceae bacterium]|jgi:predicted O-methyltransferase YrrM|nr:class I SAM-dependent methyltransferase [Steroidobacteraceae bacterium]
MLPKNSEYSIDPKFQALLARYHVRMADEDALRKKDPAGFVKRLDEFLLPIGPEVGWLLHALILGRGARRILELGTSYGYSTAFLAEAARRTGGKVYTMDVAAGKQRYARAQIEEVGLGAQVEWMLGDATEMLKTFDGPIDFVLVDLWKNLYVPCLNLFYGKLANNAVIAADNMLYPETVRADAEAYRAAVTAKGNLQSVLLPVGNGIELSCLWKS